ncbi:MAG: hypothetical protein R2724_31250 [Bryobacterales bacterium]
MPERYYQEAFDLVQRSAEAGRRWVIFHDEQNPASDGVLPDADDRTTRFGPKPCGAT